MKKVLSILSVIFLLAFTTGAQTQPFVEFQKTNVVQFEADKVIPENGTIRYINDNTDPSNVKTYIFYQRNASTPNTTPVLPADWTTFEASFDAETILKLRTEGVVWYVLTYDYATYIRINN